MPDLPTIPSTNNFYAFLTFIGIFILLFALLYPPYEIKQINDKYSNTLRELNRINYSISKQNTKLAAISENFNLTVTPLMEKNDIKSKALMSEIEDFKKSSQELYDDFLSDYEFYLMAIKEINDSGCYQIIDDGETTEFILICDTTEDENLSSSLHLALNIVYNFALRFNNYYEPRLVQIQLMEANITNDYDEYANFSNNTISTINEYSDKLDTLASENPYNGTIPFDLQYDFNNYIYEMDQSLSNYKWYIFLSLFGFSLIVYGLWNWFKQQVIKDLKEEIETKLRIHELEEKRKEKQESEVKKKIIY